MVEAQKTLFVSGFAGIAVGFSFELYRQLLLDPVILGDQVPPEWLASARLLLLLGSIVVVAYATIVPDVIGGWRDVFVAVSVLAQWGTPILFILNDILEVGSPVGFLGITAIFFHVIVAIWATISVAR